MQPENISVPANLNLTIYDFISVLITQKKESRHYCGEIHHTDPKVTGRSRIYVWEFSAHNSIWPDNKNIWLWEVKLVSRTNTGRYVSWSGTRIACGVASSQEEATRIARKTARERAALRRERGLDYWTACREEQI